jgi:hypothetical protein
MSMSVVRRASTVVATGIFNLPMAEVRATFVEEAPVSAIASSWLLVVAVHPATRTPVMEAMVVVALVAQTTVVAKEAEDMEGHQAMVEPPVGVAHLLAMAAVVVVVAWDPVVPEQPALATVFPVSRAPWVKVDQVPALSAHRAASRVPAVAIMVAVALRVATAVPAVVAVARLGLAPSPIRHSPPATQAMAGRPFPGSAPSIDGCASSRGYPQARDVQADLRAAATHAIVMTPFLFGVCGGPLGLGIDSEPLGRYTRCGVGGQWGLTGDALTHFQFGAHHANACGTRHADALRGHDVDRLARSLALSG